MSGQSRWVAGVVEAALELLQSTEAVVKQMERLEPERMAKPGWINLKGANDSLRRCLEEPLPAAGAASVRQGRTETSKAAAWAALPGSGTQRRRVLELVGRCACTDEEISHHLDMNPSSVRPRRGELVAGGWIEDSGVRKATESGEFAVVWSLTIRGREQIQGVVNP
jgi:hypothetical protein